VAVKFGYEVGEATGLKPAPVKRYTIGFGGLRTNGKYFKTCTAAQMQGSDADCNAKALVGSGTLQAFVYNDADPSGGNGGFPCSKALHIWNAGANKAVLFIGGDPSGCGGVGNLAPIEAKYVKFGTGQALQFDVPASVLHPVPGLTVAVTSVSASLPRKTVTVKKAKRAYFESIAKTHPVEVTFVTEQGQTAKATAKA
jgi:copper chaperone CopZ